MNCSGILRALTAVVFWGIFAASCKEKVDVRISCTVNNLDGTPIGEAQIFLNNQEVGKTDAAGKFSVEGIYPANASLAIKIAKDSDDQYIAPYAEKVDISAAKEQLVTVNATLLSAPKSHFDAEEKGDPRAINDIAPPPLAVAPTRESADSDSSPTPANPKEGPSPTSIQAASAPQGDKAILAVKSRVEEDRDQEPTTLPASPAIPRPPNFAINALARPEDYLLYTVYTYAADKPLDDVTIYYGDESLANIKEGCRTNVRGRCNLRLASTQTEFMTFIAKKDGYHTSSVKRHLTKNGEMKFHLATGKTVDVFALTQRYNYIQGIENVEVLIDDKEIGKTDKFGHFSYYYSGKNGDRLSIGLRTPQYIPKVSQTDFVVSETASLVRYFTPAAPPKAKVAIGAIHVVDENVKQNASSIAARLAPWLHDALKHDFFEPYLFQEVPSSKVEKWMSSLKTDMSNLVAGGWRETPIKSIVDAIIVPTLVLGDQWSLELSLINSKGNVVAAAKERFSPDFNRDDLHRVMQVIAGNLSKKFPFEGAIVGQDDKYYTINMGTTTGHNVKIGDIFSIYSAQPDASGLPKNHQKMGWASAVKVDEATTKLSPIEIKPGDEIAIGDLVECRGSKEEPGETFKFKVSDTMKAIAQANVYVGDNWAGSTDKNGLLEIKKNWIAGSTTLNVIKRGYSNFTQEVDFSSHPEIAIALKRELALLHLETMPSGAKVYMDQKQIGISPLWLPIPATSSLVKLEIKDVAGYKPLAFALELQEGSLDLSGARRINLEKDLLTEVGVLLNLGKVAQAVDKINQIGVTHSDYLMAQYRLGEIYLTMLGKPALAAKAFHNITKDPTVTNFTDKKLAGALANEGLALFQAADNLQNSGETAAATAHYKESVKVFNKAETNIKFIPADQSEEASRKLLFHRSLALSRLFMSTADESYRREAIKSWERYVNNHSDQEQNEEANHTYLEDAKMYLKQLATSAKQGKNDDKAF